MTRLPFVLAALVASTALSAQTQTQTSQTQTPPPPVTGTAPAASDVKITATPAGKWNVAVDTDNGTMASVLELKLDGKTVTGSLSGTQGVMPIQGDYTDGKLSFTITYTLQNGSIDVAFSGALKDDDTLAGTATAGTYGTFPFKATRVKDKN